MVEIWEGLLKAIGLIISLDTEVIEIAGRSLSVSVAATILAAIICIPLGSLIHFYHFKGKRILVNIIQTLYSVPTVVVGLLVFVFLSRAGPLGGFGLLYTPGAMIIGQMILITPLMTGMTVNALSGVNPAIAETARALGASQTQAITIILKESRFAVIGAVIMSFGRAISEVGLAMMVGGNIKGYTRIITTTIALETSKGNVELAMALGIILLAIALVVSIILNVMQQNR